MDAGLADDGISQLAQVPDSDASTDTILGVVLRTQVRENDLTTPYPTIKAGQSFNVLRKGRVFVSVDGAYDANSDTPFVRFTANGADKQAGMLTTSDDSGKADELGASGYGVENRVLRSTSAAGVLPIEINLP